MASVGDPQRLRMAYRSCALGMASVRRVQHLRITYSYSVPRKDRDVATLYQVSRDMLATPPRCWLINEPSWILDWDGASNFTAFNSKVTD